MATLDPVLWTKGTLLTPQHLQAQDRYLDEVLRFQLAALAFCPWGFARVAVDRDALAGGTFVLAAVAGRFPDGLLVDAPAGDPLPPPRPLQAAWEADQRALLVYLAVPEYRPGTRNVASGHPTGADPAPPGGVDRRASGSATARWRAEEQLARDETTGLAERPIQVARPNLRLVLEGEPADGYTVMPVARVVRSAAGALAVDPAFVPPLLDFAASDPLGAAARRLVERATARASALAGTRRQRNQSLADFSVTDVASFWLLYTLNTHLPALRHLAEVRRGHPSALWEAMTALAGALSTFAPAPRPLPAYDHLRLGACFAELETVLLELLETAVPESAVSLPLRLVRPSVRAAAVDQEAWLAAPHWYLAVAAPLRQPTSCRACCTAARSARRTWSTRSSARRCRGSS
jgi:type VI secretion system protein ImpJ